MGMGDQAEPRIEIRACGEAGGRVFFVRDNGLGIEPRYYEKASGLFDKAVFCFTLPAPH
jgi:C4-dicarboxylate-specific signal transduction histidine kinase